MTTEVKPRTSDEIAKLKQDWAKDPCWDLHETEGFEAHTEELRLYAAYWEARTNCKVEIGLIDEEIASLKQALDKLRARRSRLADVVIYMGGSMP